MTRRWFQRRLSPRLVRAVPREEHDALVVLVQHQLEVVHQDRGHAPRRPRLGVEPGAVVDETSTNGLARYLHEPDHGPDLKSQGRTVFDSG